MENQLIINNQKPVDLPVSSTKTNTLILIPIIVFVCLIVFGFGGFYLGRRSVKAPSDIESLPNVTTQVISPTPTSSSTTPQVNSTCLLTGYNGQSIGSIGKNNSCNVDVPIEESLSYRLLYPQDWKIRLAGAAGVNLFFNENTPESIFVQVVPAELPLDQSEKAIARFEMASDPIINSGESIISKKMSRVGEKSLFLVDTTQANVKYVYYFLQISSSKNKWLFVFKIQDNINSRSRTENLISTLTLVPGGFPKYGQ